ncbi:helix-turn-helix domain-containing protein [Actinokineospora sp. HUAS TT18]|uniref:helix-turn-helix domain-containing protein n=1 Tax=Actinokineospora sp. HUAS TT18 TaxID=3447451 RepID=UPI003F51B83A
MDDVTREATAIAELRRALGERLATFRKAASVTQAQLSAHTYCDRTRIAHLEKGRARADEQFWQAADEFLRAEGGLLASFVEFRAAKYQVEHDQREAELAVVRDRIDGWRQTDIADGTSDARSPIDQDLTAVFALLGPTHTLAMLDTYTQSVVTRYELEGPNRLAPEVRALRRLSQRLSERVSGAEEREQLARIGARQAALLAYMAVNLGQFAAAERFALEAAMLATALDDLPLLAWVKGTQSFAAYYQQRYQEALSLAQIGLQIAGNDRQRVRLLSNGVARAAGKLGDRRVADKAIDEALNLVDDGPRTMTSCIDFQPYGWARTAANAATAYLSLGDAGRVLDLTRQLNTVVADSESDWSRSLVSLDEATALTLGPDADLEHAAAVGMSALAASASKPIESVGSRARELALSLKQRGTGQASREFATALSDWKQGSRGMSS